MNLIHQNTHRNRMAQSMLNAHMHIRSGVEKKENREDCLKCEDPEKPEHCHCVEAKISDTMRENCRKAWKKCQLAGCENSHKQKHVSESNEEKRKYTKRKRS